MKKLYFITGSQDLYGEDVLKTVGEDSKKIAEFINSKIGDVVEVVYETTVRNNEECIAALERANIDSDCVGIITWMHTFSPAKMWIKGLQILHKPLCHLHTQFNEKLPYDTIDMDFMNLNQAAHGDREFGFILSRLHIPHEVVVGYYQHKHTLEDLRRFGEVCKAIDYSKKLRVACLGNNMREVAVTDGDRVESQIKFGWEVNYYGIGDLVDIIEKVSPAEVDAKMEEYAAKYVMNTTNLDAVREQAKYEIALEKFLAKERIGAFVDTFQDLHGLKQLPGLAVQRLLNKGIGFAAEGDYKTSALCAVLSKYAENRKGATGFMEDYTYDLTEGHELELGSHMLEVPECFADGKAAIEVHPLGIGGKEDPARLVFDGITGDAIAICMTDMGDRFRLVCAHIELVKQPKKMPKLPVARIMWKIKPNLVEGAKGWLEAGGGHHTVVSTAITKQDIELFAKLTNTEVTFIGF